MSVRAFVALIGAAVTVIGVILLSVTVHAMTENGTNVKCGNGFHTDWSEAAHQHNVDRLAEILAPSYGLSGVRYDDLDGYQLACDSALDTRRIIGFGLLGMGLVVAAGAAVVRRPTAVTSPAEAPSTESRPETSAEV